MKKVEKIEEFDSKIGIALLTASALTIMGAYVCYQLQGEQDKVTKYELLTRLTNDAEYIDLAVDGENNNGLKTSKGAVSAEIYDDVAIVRFKPLRVLHDDNDVREYWIYPSDSLVEDTDGYQYSGRKIVSSEVVKDLLDKGYEFNTIKREGNYLDSPVIVSATATQVKQYDGTTKMIYSVPDYTITSQEYEQNLSKKLK